MNTKPLLAPFYLMAATFVGIADTLYLSIYAYQNKTPGCALQGCEVVLNSVYSKPFGVPFAYVGLVYYVYMLGLAILLALDPKSKGLRLGTLLYTGIGFGLSICFEIFQATVIHALCMYCAISAFTTLVLFCVAIWHWRVTRT